MGQDFLDRKYLNVAISSGSLCILCPSVMALPHYGCIKNEFRMVCRLCVPNVYFERNILANLNSLHNASL